MCIKVIVTLKITAGRQKNIQGVLYDTQLLLELRHLISLLI